MIKTRIILFFAFILAINSGMVNGQTREIPAPDELKKVLNPGELKNLDQSQAMYEHANSLMVASEKGWKTLDEIRLKTIATNNATEKQKLFNDAAGLKDKADKDEKEALEMYKLANDLAFSVYNKAFQRFRTKFKGEDDIKEEAALLEEIAVNYFNEARFKRESIDKSGIPLESLELLHDICDMELLSIKKQVKAYSLYLGFEFKIAKKEEIYYNPVEFVEVAYGDEQLVEEYLAAVDAGTVKPGEYMGIEEEFGVATDGEATEQNLKDEVSGTDTFDATDVEADGEYEEYVVVENGREVKKRRPKSRGSSGSVYTPSGKIDRSKVKILLFKVQIAADTAAIPEHMLQALYNGFYPINHRVTRGGWYKYTIGQFNNYQQALDLRKNCNVMGAFVTVYLNGRRISIEEGIRVSKQIN